MSAMKPCKTCKEPIAPNAKPCPKCGEKEPHPNYGLLIVGGIVMVLLAVICCSGQANAEGDAWETPERWEYCQVKVYRDDARAFSGGEDYWRVEGYWGCEVSSTKPWKYPTQALNELGADGWRLVPDSTDPWTTLEPGGRKYLLERRLR